MIDAQELQQHQEHLQQLLETRTAELRAANQQLQQEICDRQEVEAALRQAEATQQTLINDLDIKVKQHTTELEEVIRQLQTEIALRQQAELALQEREWHYLSICELTSDYVYSVEITADGQLITEGITASFRTHHRLQLR